MSYAKEEGVFLSEPDALGRVMVTAQLPGRPVAQSASMEPEGAAALARAVLEYPSPHGHHLAVIVRGTPGMRGPQRLQAPEELRAQALLGADGGGPTAHEVRLDLDPVAALAGMDSWHAGLLLSALWTLKNAQPRYPSGHAQGHPGSNSRRDAGQRRLTGNGTQGDAQEPVAPNTQKATERLSKEAAPATKRPK